FPVRREFDYRCGHGLRISAIDDRAQLAAKHTDAEASAEEREVNVKHFAREPLEIGFDTLLLRAFYDVRHVQRAPAEDDARILLQINLRQRGLVEAEES